MSEYLSLNITYSNFAKIMYPALNALRSTVCFAHEWENTVLPYNLLHKRLQYYARAYFTNRKLWCAVLLYKTSQAVKNEVLNFISSQPYLI